MRCATACAAAPPGPLPQQGAVGVRSGRTIYVLPPKLSRSSGTPRDKPPGPPRMAFGRPCATDTEAGAVTPAGLRSKQLASAYDMVPVSVLLRESGPTSWVVMDEAAVPVDAERAQILLEEAYAVRTRAVEEKKAAVEEKEKVEKDLEAATAETKRLAQELKSQQERRQAQDRRQTQTRRQAGRGGGAAAGLTTASSVVKRAEQFRQAFARVDQDGLGKIAKRTLLERLRTDATALELLRIPAPPAATENGENEGSREFTEVLESLDMKDDDEIEQEEFVSFSTVGLFKRVARMLASSSTIRECAALPMRACQLCNSSAAALRFAVHLMGTDREPDQ